MLSRHTSHHRRGLQPIRFLPLSSRLKIHLRHTSRQASYQPGHLCLLTVNKKTKNALNNTRQLYYPSNMTNDSPNKWLPIVYFWMSRYHHNDLQCVWSIKIFNNFNNFLLQIIYVYIKIDVFYLFLLCNVPHLHLIIQLSKNQNTKIKISNNIDRFQKFIPVNYLALLAS